MSIIKEQYSGYFTPKMKFLDVVSHFPFFFISGVLDKSCHIIHCDITGAILKSICAKEQ